MSSTTCIFNVTFLCWCSLPPSCFSSLCLSPILKFSFFYQLTSKCLNIHWSELGVASKGLISQFQFSLNDTLGSNPYYLGAFCIRFWCCVFFMIHASCFMFHVSCFMCPQCLHSGTDQAGCGPLSLSLPSPWSAEPPPACLGLPHPSPPAPCLPAKTQVVTFGPNREQAGQTWWTGEGMGCG